MENGSVNTLKFVICFHFQVKAFDDYVMLHNSSMLFTYIVTLYHIHCAARDVVIVSLSPQ